MPTRQTKRAKSLAKSLLRKNAGNSLRGSKAEGTTSDEDSVNDTASIVSAASENRSLCDDGVSEDVDEQSQEEVFEEKLKESIDGCIQKSLSGRVQSLESCSRALSQRYAPDFLSGRRMTVSDAVERCLRKGKGAEQAAAAHLAALLCLQLGATEHAEDTYAQLRTPLLHVVLDSNATSAARAKCCWSLGVCSFVCGGGDLETEELLLALEAVLSSPQSLSVECGEVGWSAVSSWALLLSLLHPGRVALLAPSRIPLIARLLDSPDLDLRIGAGEALALLLEMAREARPTQHNADDEQHSEDGPPSDDFLQLPAELLPLLADKLHQLATDSHKYRAKKDRKQQRSSFRDIVRGVQDQEAPCVQVRFGPEALLLNSWRRKRQYDAVCQALGSGTNIHLATNDLVRDIFELGGVLPLNAPVHKVTKFERHMMNVSAFKARTLSRSRNRDKRSVVVAY